MGIEFWLVSRTILKISLKPAKIPTSFLPEGDSTSKNIKGNELKFELASEKEFDTIHTEFLAFKKKMDLLKGQNGKFKKGKKNKRGGYKGKVVDRNAEDNQEKEAKNTRKRFADSDDEGAEAKVAKNE